MKKVLIVIFVGLLCAVFYSFGVTTYENIKVNSIIEDFMKDAKLVRETDTYIYYEVDNPNADNEYSAFSNSNEDSFGQSGDVIVAFGSNFPDLKAIDWFISYYFGFHAALVLGDERVGEAVITSVESANDIIFNALWPREEDFPEDVFGPTGVKEYNNNYFIRKSGSYGDYHKGFYANGIVGLRFNDITDNDRMRACDEALSIIYDEKQIYNYLFPINNKKGYYCTSFIEEVFKRFIPENKEEPYDTNCDSFTSGINDLILARETYIFSYFRVNENGKGEIYYLEGNNGYFDYNPRKS